MLMTRIGITNGTLLLDDMSCLENDSRSPLNRMLFCLQTKVEPS
jgi:hypothetical protein